jgi:hypothetical protein
MKCKHKSVTVTREVEYAGELKGFMTVYYKDSMEDELDNTVKSVVCMDCNEDLTGKVTLEALDSVE